MTRRSVIGIVVAAVVLVGGAWAVRGWQLNNGLQAPAKVTTNGMEGMDGMTGMNPSPDGSINLTADEIRTMGVTIGEAQVRPLVTGVRATGTVMVDETRVVQVAARVGGFVEQLLANVTGQPVRSGQPLLELYSPVLLAAQEEMLLALELERSMGQSAVPGIPTIAIDVVAAAKRRFALWNIDEAQIDEVLRTRRTRRTLTMFAPASGVVTTRNVTQGQSVQPGDVLYVISDLSRVWVQAVLRGADVGSVRVGTQADIEISGFIGRPFKGRVEYVSPMVDAETRTTQARIAVANAGGLIKPGMYATVRLSTPATSALTVPSTAVLRTGERAMVFVEMTPGKLMPHEVDVGSVAGDYTEILAGVAAGARVVTSAQFLLDSESNLGEVMKSMLGMGGGTPRIDGTDVPKQRGSEMNGMAMPAEKVSPRSPSRLTLPPTVR